MAQILHWLIKKHRSEFTNRVLRTEWAKTHALEQGCPTYGPRPARRICVARRVKTTKVQALGVGITR